MASANQVGFLLDNRLERDLVHSAALDCGLEPVDLASLLPSNLPDQPRRPAPSWPPLLVIDETASLPELLHDYTLAGHDIPLILRIGDPLHPDPSPTTPESLAWPLPRPLFREALQTTLRHALRALALLTARQLSLLEELDRLRSIFGSVTNGITIADASLPDLPLTYVNSAFERMTGYSAAEAVGHNCRYLQGPERDQPESLIVRRALREGREARVVLRNYRKDGTLFWNELYMSPILDPAGRVTYYVGIQRDVTVEIESAQRLQYLAHHDALTGVANRNLLMSQLKQSLARALRNVRTVAVLFFDLNNFKQVNDMLGHDAGDQLLKVVAERLRSSVRSGETVARLGGDEFVVVLEDLSGQRHPAAVLERLLSCLRQPIDILGVPIIPSASVGMALFPDDGATAEALLKAADLKMYVAKHHSQASEQIDNQDAPTSRQLAHRT